MYETRFRVRGRGAFPLDMLRIDRCFPDREVEDSYGLARVEPREIQLCVLHKGRKPPLSLERWASYNWPVDPRTVVTRAI